MWINFIAGVALAAAAEQPYLLSTVAGNTGGIGDGGPASAAALAGVNDLAVDRAGNVYIADRSRIRKIDRRTSIIDTIAGNGFDWNQGDGIAARLANINPGSIAVDSKGTVYLNEMSAPLVRRIDTDGIIRIAAGTGWRGSSGDSGFAHQAGLSNPVAIAVDPSSDVLYIADGPRLRFVTAEGMIRTLATLPDTPRDITVNTAGLVYAITESRNILRISPPDGRIALVYEYVTGSLAPDRLSASATTGDVLVSTFRDRLLRIPPQGPIGLLPTSAGNINFLAADGVDGAYVSGSQYPLAHVTAHGTVTPIVAYQAGTFSSPGEECPATNAAFAAQGVEMDSDGSIYLTDVRFNRIRRIDRHGIVTTVAGDGFERFAGDGRLAKLASLQRPLAIRVDRRGDLIIADSGNSRIRRVDRSGGGIITTIAGTGAPESTGDNGPAVSASVAWPRDLAVDADNNIYFTESQTHRVRRISARDGTISTVAGTGTAGFTGDGGPGAQALVDFPFSLAIDRNNGILYIGHSFGIRRLHLSTGIITTVTRAIELPTAMATTPDGTSLYVTETYKYRIWKVPVADPGLLQPPQLLAGTGTQGLEGDDGPSLEANLAGPAGIAVDPSSHAIYFVDLTPGNFYSYLRKLEPAQIFPRRIVNSANPRPGFLAAGTVIDIGVIGMGAEEMPTAVAPLQDGAYPLEFGGIRVWIDGRPAPVRSVSPGRVQAILPFLTAAQSGTRIEVQIGNQRSNRVAKTIIAANPGLYSADGSGTGQAAATNADASTNSASNPAPRASKLTILGTGGGLLAGASVSEGSIASSRVPLMLPVRARIDGLEAEVVFAGSAPGFATGIFQIEVLIPGHARPGPRVPVQISVGGVWSQTGLWVAIQ